MPHSFTLFTGQWADLPLEEVCRLASSWGYDGLELAGPIPVEWEDAGWTG
jgi:sugar phosphate isomerase/epimerase